MSSIETTATGGKGRTVGAWICFALATLLFLLSSVAYWGARTLNDTERYVATVAPLVNSPEVQDAISAKVTAAIESHIDVEATINEVFGDLIKDKPRLQLLVGPLAGAINGLIANQVDAIVKSDKFSEFWVTANTQLQERLVALLRGEDGGALSLQGDDVVLDVGTVIDAVKTRLIAQGLTVLENVPIPEVDKQVVLLKAPQLQQARTIYAFTNPVASWLIWVVLLLFVGAFLLSKRRPRMTVAIGIAIAANALLLAWILQVGGQLFVNELAGTVWGPASTVFWDTLFVFLVRTWHTMLWLALILVVAGWFAGRNKSGTATREFLSNAARTGGASLADGPLAGAGAFVATNVRWLRWVVVLLGAVVLVWGSDLTPEKLLWATVLVVVLLLVLEFLVGAGGGAVTTDGPDATDASTDVVAEAGTHDTLVVPADAGTNE